MNEFIKKYNSLIDEKRLDFLLSLTDDQTQIIHSEKGFYQIGYFPKSKFSKYCPLKHNSDFRLNSFSETEYVLNSNNVNLELINLLKKINPYKVLKLEDRMKFECNIWLYGKKIE